jgi:hypothetical protein
MNYWKQVLLPLLFWLAGSWAETLILPPVSAGILKLSLTTPSQQTVTDISIHFHPFRHCRVGIKKPPAAFPAFAGAASRRQAAIFPCSRITHTLRAAKWLRPCHGNGVSHAGLGGLPTSDFFEPTRSLLCVTSSWTHVHVNISIIQLSLVVRDPCWPVEPTNQQSGIDTFAQKLRCIDSWCLTQVRSI